MADEFQLGSGNWWDSPRARFESGSSSSASTTLNSSSNSSVGISFGWPTEVVETKGIRPSMDSSMSAAASAGSSSIVFQDTHKLQVLPESSSTSAALLPDPNLQIMALGLSPQGVDWNQALLRGEKSESSFRSILQDDHLSSNTNFQQQTAGGGMGGSLTQQDQQWRQHHSSSVDRGFSIDQQQQQPQFSINSHISSSDSNITSQSLATSNFQMDNSAAAVYGSPYQELMLAAETQQQSSFETNRLMSYPYGSSSYGSSNYPPFLRPSSQKQPQHNHLHFSNNAPYWNASSTNTASTGDVRSSFFQTLHTQFPSPNFDDKPKNTLEVRDNLASMTKKSSNEPSNKRPRNESPSSLPAFKVRKEKMGDRITALQQLVSPFGKTDTASVLSEAIEYIKFLHEQVSVLSTPYMKNGAPIPQHQQGSDKSMKETADGPKQDLRSRGLCLVPISSTFPITHETSNDFWTPTFGGTYR